MAINYSILNKLCKLVAITAVWFGLMLATATCFAQKTHVDTLLQQLKNHPKEDTARLNLLNNISRACCVETEFEKSIAYADSAIGLAGKLGMQLNLAEAYVNKATALQNKNDFKPAILSFSTALKIYEQRNDQRNKILTGLSL